jgi:hypothetical protein
MLHFDPFILIIILSKSTLKSLFFEEVLFIFRRNKIILRKYRLFFTFDQGVIYIQGYYS